MKETGASNFLQAQIRPTQQATFSTELPHVGRKNLCAPAFKADIAKWDMDDPSRS